MSGVLTPKSPELKTPELQRKQEVEEAKCENIQDKEERALFEMLHSLTTNMEVLDSVRQVFEQEDPNERLSQEESDDDYLSGDEVQILQSIFPERSEFAKGKALFVIKNDESIFGHEADPEIQAASRNAYIAKNLNSTNNISVIETNNDGAS